MNIQSTRGDLTGQRRVRSRSVQPSVVSGCMAADQKSSATGLPCANCGENPKYEPSVGTRSMESSGRSTRTLSRMSGPSASIHVVRQGASPVRWCWNPLPPGVSSESRPKSGRTNNEVLPAYSGLALNHFPDFGTQPVGAADGIHIQRKRPGVGDVDVVQRDPQQARRELPHDPARDEHRQLVGTLPGSARSQGSPRRTLSTSPSTALISMFWPCFRLGTTAIRSCRAAAIRNQRARPRAPPTPGAAWAIRHWRPDPVRTYNGGFRRCARSRCSLRSRPGVRRRPVQALAEVLEDRRMLRAAQQ